MVATVEIEIVNRLGLHARACAKLVKTAAQFECAISLSSGETLADAKSIMSLMMLAASQGARLMLSAEGADADAAIQEIQALVQGRFGEEE